MTITTCLIKTLNYLSKKGVRTLGLSKKELARQKREAEQTFNSFAYLLREKLEGADHILTRIDHEASAVGVSTDFRREYMRDRLIQMIAEIAEEREAKKNAM